MSNVLKLFSFFILSFFALILPFVVSQSEESCTCQPFCSSISSSDIVIKGFVKHVKCKDETTKYKIKVHHVFKGKVHKNIWVYVDSQDSCIQRLSLKNEYLLLLNEKKHELWLSSCFNQKWETLSDKDLEYLKMCSSNDDGSICKNGTEMYYCFIEPCFSMKTACPEAETCVNDYCGGCFAHYFDKKGNEICQMCPEKMCKIYCQFGYVVDENGCNTCKCNDPPTCSDNSNPVQCFINPCQNQITNCPDAVRCQPDYCGGCFAHYFDKNGNEICSNCPQVLCSTRCEFGYVYDKHGCQTCDCVNPPICLDGSRPSLCKQSPCLIQGTMCPEASRCVDDYCGGCNAHFYDSKGNEICQNCSQILCDIYCEFGHVLDEQGCKTCRCKDPPKCPDGSQPVNCFADPCLEQPTKCPDAIRCVSDYCGGCNAHYYDESGNEICN